MFTSSAASPTKRLKKGQRLAVVIRGGWSKGSNIPCEILKLYKKLSNFNYENDYTIKVKDPADRLCIMEKVICVYNDEIDECRETLRGRDSMGFRIVGRPRSTFGEEFFFMTRHLVENPGYILISDYGLNQYLAMDDSPGQPPLSIATVAAKLALVLRLMDTYGVVLCGLRHQNGKQASVEGVPAQPESGRTAYLNFENPNLIDVQQFLIVGSKAKAESRPWNFLEDRALALDEQRISGKGSVAIFEGMTVRFAEKELAKDRYYGEEEWKRNAGILKKEYGVKLRERSFPKSHG